MQNNPTAVFTHHGIQQRERSQVKEGLPGLVPHRIIHVVELIDDVIPQICVGCGEGTTGEQAPGWWFFFWKSSVSSAFRNDTFFNLTNLPQDVDLSECVIMHA